MVCETEFWKRNSQMHHSISINPRECRCLPLTHTHTHTHKSNIPLGASVVLHAWGAPLPNTHTLPYTHIHTVTHSHTETLSTIHTTLSTIHTHACTHSMLFFWLMIFWVSGCGMTHLWPAAGEAMFRSVTGGQRRVKPSRVALLLGIQRTFWSDG